MARLAKLRTPGHGEKMGFGPRPTHALSIGAPVDLGAFNDVEATPRVLREITALIMLWLRHDLAELRELSEPTGSRFVRRRAYETSSDAA